jgi:hypothetical protein
LSDELTCTKCGQRLFVCELCKDTFHSKTPSAQAEAEYLRNFTDEEHKGGRSSVCDDCYEIVMERVGKHQNQN